MSYLDKLPDFGLPESFREEITIEPVSTNGRPVFWERSDGRIDGPAAPEFLAQIGLGLKPSNFWVVATYDGAALWIRSDRLRSRRDFEEHRELS